MDSLNLNCLKHDPTTTGTCGRLINSLSHSVSAISVDLRPIASPTADKFVELLDRRADNLTGVWSWWKEIMGCGVSTKNIGRPIMCLSSNIDLLIR